MPTYRVTPAQLGAAQLGAFQLGAAGPPSALVATYPPMTLPAAVELPSEMQFGVPRRVPLDRQEFGNEMAAAVFGGWLGSTVEHTTGAALLGGLAGWLGYRRISRRDRG
jgi:hypothetical protein